MNPSPHELDAGPLTGSPEPVIDGGQGEPAPRRKREVGGVVRGQIELARDLGSSCSS